KTKAAPKGRLCSVRLADQAICFANFRLRRQPTKPSTPIPLMKSGSAPGIGVSPGGGGAQLVHASSAPTKPVFPAGLPTSARNKTELPLLSVDRIRLVIARSVPAFLKSNVRSLGVTWPPQFVQKTP